jgi:hypothetical protein
LAKKQPRYSTLQLISLSLINSLSFHAAHTPIQRSSSCTTQSHLLPAMQSLPNRGRFAPGTTPTLINKTVTSWLQHSDSSIQIVSFDFLHYFCCSHPVLSLSTLPPSCHPVHRSARPTLQRTPRTFLSK